MATLRAIGQDRADCQQALQGLAGVLEELRELEKEEEVEREAKEREEAEEGRGRKRRRENAGVDNEKESLDKEMEKEVRRQEDEAIGFDADDEDEDGDEDEAEDAAEGLGRPSSAHDYMHTRNRSHHFDDPSRNDGLGSDFDDDEEDDYLDDEDFYGGEAMDVDEEFGEVLQALDGSYERLYENMWAMDERLSRIEKDVRELGGAGSMLAVVDGQAR